jgi:hypothetical protein
LTAYVNRYRAILEKRDQMVNENFDKFNKVQHQHQGEYLGSNQKQPAGINDSEYNNQDNTDKSVGATGRNRNLK